MAIGTAPIKESIAGGLAPPVWVGWFQKITTALMGWRETFHLYDDQGVTILAVPAQSSQTYIVSAPGVVTSRHNVIGNPAGVFQDGISWNVAIVSQDEITVKLTNATSGSINVTLGAWRFIVFIQ